MTIRQATLNDLTELAYLFDQYRQFYGQAPAVDEARTFLEERLRNNESIVFMAFDGEQAVGFTQLYPIFTSVGMRRSWLLNDLFVTEAARKKGAATQLLEAAKNHATQTAAKWLMLQTGADNTTAQRVYEMNGWEKVSDLFYQYNLS